MTSRFLPLSLVLAAVVAGCATTRYGVDPQELQRLVQVPPEARGRQVGVHQIVEDAQAAAAPAPVVVDAPPPVIVEPTVVVGVGVPVPGPVLGPRPVAGPAWVGTPARAVAPASGAFRGAPTAHAAVPWHAAPAHAGGGHGGGFHGGGGHGDAVGAAVVGIIAIAAIAAIIASNQPDEAPFDGWASVKKDQPLHLVYMNGQELVLPLSALTPAYLPGVAWAYLRDDEGRVTRVSRPQ